jgi:hypothetical protein
MTTKDLRKEINRVIEKVPDDFLAEILTYLKEVENKTEQDLSSIQRIKRILKEDKDLLEKLAE